MLFCLNTSTKAKAADEEERRVSGKVVDEKGEALVGVQIILQKLVAVTNTEGIFEFVTNASKGRLTIAYLGFEPVEKEVNLKDRQVDVGTIVMREKRVWASNEAVITATRTIRDAEAVAQPVTVVSQKEIQQAGSLRLSDILLEQVGMVLTANHGTGIQLQGMDADYTLILVDGQPLIGRTAGTFDLTRISVGNIKQIEIVKGPSSALWGSEALGGVINIITEKPRAGYKTELTTRYGSFNTSDLGVQSSFSTGTYAQTIFFNRNASDGYRLNQDALSNTVPEFHNYTFNYRGNISLTENTELELRSRIYTEFQENQGGITQNDALRLLRTDAYQYDINIIPILKYRINGKHRLELMHNSTWFGANTVNRLTDNNELFSESPFEQRFHRTEFQWDATWNLKHRSTSGAGYTSEGLVASRFPDNPVFQSAFGFVQHDWDVSKRFNITAGVRTDLHSEFSGEVSPKIGLRFEIFENFHLKASAGNGFKAPDFRQLFLNFNNATAGYSVFGTSSAREGLADLQARGEISRFVVSPDAVSSIQAERSFAVNIGLEYLPVKSLRLKLNAFRNNVNNLIDVQPIAVKNNGQSVFTYFNLNEVFLQGIEAEMQWEVVNGLSFMAGYAYLEAKDQQVIRDIQAGQVFRRNPITRRDERVSLQDYGGLFNRSAHSGSARLFYTSPSRTWETSFRMIYRGRYGFMDRNNNQILDQANEFEEGYALFNYSVTHLPNQHIRLQAGIDNLFNFTRPDQLGFLPGRIFYVQLHYTL